MRIKIYSKKLKKYKDVSRNPPKNKNCMRIKYFCDWCGEISFEKESSYKRKDKHFCCTECYSNYRREIMKLSEQNAYKGVRKEGESKQIYHRRYVKAHPEIISHLKARRYALEKGATGNHSLKEWNDLKKKYKYRCAICFKIRKLTKDHIIPLSKGGTDYIENIQPLCRNCNSKKSNHIENPELLLKKGNSKNKR